MKAERVACRERSYRYLNLPESRTPEVGQRIAAGQHKELAGRLARLFQHDGLRLSPRTPGGQRQEE